MAGLKPSFSVDFSVNEDCFVSNMVVVLVGSKVAIVKQLQFVKRLISVLVTIYIEKRVKLCYNKQNETTSGGSMGEISVSSDFQQFCKNLRMSDKVVSNIQSRYHAITKRINHDFWGSDSETLHSLYVGSYGRGTAIHTSDIDIVVELPWTEYSKYNSYSGNGQSALLQAVRNSLLKTYSTSRIGADGQVVDIMFSDGVKFEVVPAFKYSDDSGYCYADTNNGGSWKSMNPKLEILTFNGRNSITNGNLKRLCQMMRAWNATKCVLMPGILIDTLAYRFMQQYEYADKSYSYYDWMSRDFFQYMVEVSNQDYWLKPGSNQRVYAKYGFKREAEEARAKCLDALEYYNKNYNYLWNDKWREIYGNKFPATS